MALHDLYSETIICNVNQSSIQPEIIYFVKFLTIDVCLLGPSMDFRASNTGITNYFFPTALVNKETLALLGVLL